MTTLFQTIFLNANISNIAYNPKWENDTGYFDNATSGKYAPVLEKNQVVKTTDNTGRKIIIIGLDGIENLVLFERYTDNKKSIVNNVNIKVDGIVYGNHAITDEILVKIFTNLGFEVSTPVEVEKETPNVILIKTESSNINDMLKTVAWTCITIVGIAFLSTLVDKK